MRASELIEQLNDFLDRYGDLRVGNEDGQELAYAVYSMGEGPPLTDSDYIEMRFTYKPVNF